MRAVAVDLVAAAADRAAKVVDPVVAVVRADKVVVPADKVVVLAVLVVAKEAAVQNALILAAKVVKTIKTKSNLSNPAVSTPS